MTIVDKIISSIKTAMGFKFPVYYHDEPTLNVMASEMKFPCAIFQLLSSGRVERGPQARETVTAAVFFVEPATEWDDDAVANEVIIDRCKTNAMTWLSSLNTSGLLEASGVVRTSRVYDRYDDILTGFGVSVDLTELYGICNNNNNNNNNNN